MAPAQEQALAVLVVLGICAMSIYWFVQWVMKAPRTGDPWDKEIDQALTREDAVEVCHHCLTPQTHNGWFCPECGAIVGPYCNYMPYLYIFSEGEVLRAGVTERMRRSPLIVLGYVLVSSVMSVVAAPVYWFFLFKNLHRRDDARPPPVPPLDNAAEKARPSIEEETDTEGDGVKTCTWCGRQHSEDATVCPIDGYPLARKKRQT